MIRINLAGQFGNQMYQYAFCRSIGEYLGYNYSIGLGKNYHFMSDHVIKNLEKTIFSLFNIKLDSHPNNLLYNYREDDKLSSIKTIDNNYKKNIFRELENIKDFTLLNGFYQNPVFFDEKDVQKYFKIDIDQFKNNSVLNNFNLNEYCIIHYRRMEAKCFELYDYYKDVLKYTNSNKFIIITDDVKEANIKFNWMKKDGIKHHIMKNDILFDLYLMSIAKNLVISKSTFSDWGAFLNKNGNIIAPFVIRKYYPSNIKYYDYENKKLVKKHEIFKTI